MPPRSPGRPSLYEASLEKKRMSLELDLPFIFWRGGSLILFK